MAFESFPNVQDMLQVILHNMKTVDTDKNSLDDFLQLIVQDQYEGATHAPQHIGPSALEEGLAALVACDLPPAVQGAGVHDVS